eukprot:10306781-Alexandrium_andersonii.AAC.1
MQSVEVQIASVLKSNPMSARGRRFGGEIEVKWRAPTGKSVSVSCTCRACGRGEAACVRARRGC